MKKPTYEELERENARLREGLVYISMASHGCPVVIDGKDVPDKWQEEIRRASRHLGEHAENVLSNKESEHA